LAERALNDPNPAVRAAAATALGQMHAIESIHKLQKLLSDPTIAVVMAAAHSLRDLKDNRSAYDVYYDVLTGERKGDGLIVQQMDTPRNPKELAKNWTRTGDWLRSFRWHRLGRVAIYTQKRSAPGARCSGHFSGARS